MKGWTNLWNEEQIELLADALAQKAASELKRACKAILTGKVEASVQAFDFAYLPLNDAGAEVKYVVFVAHEAPAIILQAAAEAFDKADVRQLQISEAMHGNPKDRRGRPN